MSHSFYIQGVGEASLKETLAALPYDDLVVDTQDYNGGWPQICHIYQEGVSVRAIETAMENDTLQVRIMAHSSPDDFRLAAAIVDHIASKYGKDIQPEDNESMPVDRWRDEYGDEWQRELCLTYLQMMVGRYKKTENGSMRMFGTRMEFEVGPRMMETLLEDPENFSKNFFDRFRRLNYLDREDVFGPSLLSAQQEGTEKRAVFAVLGNGVVTALSNQAAFVVLNNMVSGNDDDHITIKFDDFVDVAGDTLTWLGDGVAVTPSYEDAAWEQLVEKARQKQTDLFAHPELLRDPEELTESGNAEADGDEERLFGMGEEHWEIVAHSIVAVFLLVAGADGNVDKKEAEAFQKKFVEGMVGDSECKIMPVALIRAIGALDQRISDISQRDGGEIAKLVAASRQVVEQTAGPERASIFARALYDIAESIAMASGGGFLGLGSKIGKEEKVVLDGIRQLLQLETLH